ncbi:MAG: hypothetical protein OEY34_07990, partial [Cyclobacteriaceae bacterium]|nr:hypothetical protein [Cyclobacteriaceae bacterium]
MVRLCYNRENEPEKELLNPKKEDVNQIVDQLDWNIFHTITIWLNDNQNASIAGSFSEGMVFGGYDGKDVQLFDDEALKSKEEIKDSLNYYLVNHTYKQLKKDLSSETSNKYRELSTAQLVDFFVEKMRDNAMEFTEMRKQMEAYELPNEKISKVIYLVDNQIRRDVEMELNNKKAKTMFVTGIVIALVGVVYTVISFATGGSSFVFFYGAMGGG